MSSSEEFSDKEYSDFLENDVENLDIDSTGSESESDSEIHTDDTCSETESDTHSDSETRTGSDSDDIENVYVTLHIPLEKEIDGELSNKKVSCCIRFPNNKEVRRARSSLFQLEEIEYWIEDNYKDWYLSQEDDIIEICDRKKKYKVDIDLTN